MYLNLVSDDGKSSVNFNFTKFFSEKGYIGFNPYTGKNKFIKRESSHYKQMIRNLVDKYINININMVNEYYKPPIEIVDIWFKQALEEELTVPQKEFLQENYQMFRKMYNMDGKLDKFIEKLNKVKTRFNVGKVVSWRLRLGECSCLATNFFIVVYDKSEGLNEWDIGENKELEERDNKIESVLKIYEPAINNSEFLFDVSVKNIKLLNKGFKIDCKKAFVEVNDKLYDLSLIESYLNVKEPVEVWQYRDKLLLRQNDRDIILMKTSGSKEPFEVNRLEDFKNA